MTGAASQPLARPMSPSAAAANSPAASKASALSIHNVAEKLALYAQSTPAIDVAFFFTHCISLARGIDSAIANNEFPAHVTELPKIFKQICQGVKEDTLQPALMVLLISVKNACKAYWFPDEDTQELLALVDEVGKNFSTPEGFNCEENNVLPVLLPIISRYHPCIRLGYILASVDIKPGFEACVVDFHVSKNIAYSATEKIRMIVAKKDDISTSACLITPPKVNFLLNGKSVQGRSVGCMDPRPQPPTSINHMIKYGTNLLQAVGNFDAHYVVLIAFMSALPHTDLPAPDNYICPPVDVVNSGIDIVAESTLVSLECPISFNRIRTPAKGRTCTHLQCFDYNSYIEMNSKRPLWRCPHCNQAVSFPEIRIDQHMNKILKLVPEEDSEVIIHSNGSWEFARGLDNHELELQAKAIEAPPEELDQQQAPRLIHIYDLTGDDEDMIPVDTPVHEDRTPKGASHQSHSGTAIVPAANGEQQAIMGNNPQSSSSALVRTPSPNSSQQSQNTQTMSSPLGHATSSSSSTKPAATPEHPQMHALSPRASSIRDPAQQRQLPQSRWPTPAPQTSESQDPFYAPPYMEPPPTMLLQISQLRAGVNLRMTQEERYTMQENARRAGERATLPARIQTLPPPTALRPRAIPSSGFSSEQPPTPQWAAQDTPPNESWRPAGRMRGSLAGRAADALGGMIIRPSQAPPTPAPPLDQMSGANSIALSAQTLQARRNLSNKPNTPQKP